MNASRELCPTLKRAIPPDMYPVRRVKRLDESSLMEKGRRLRAVRTHVDEAVTKRMSRLLQEALVKS